MRRKESKTISNFFLFSKVYLFTLRESAQASAEKERIPGRLPAVSIEPSAGLDLTHHEIRT